MHKDLYAPLIIVAVVIVIQSINLYCEYRLRKKRKEEGWGIDDHFLDLTPGP